MSEETREKPLLPSDRWSYDFIEHFDEADRREPPLPGSDIKPDLTATCGQESKRGIFEHPPMSASEFSTLTYDVVVPAGIRLLKLECFIGIETEIQEPGGPRPSHRQPDNPVLFEVLINGQLNFQKRKTTSQWDELSNRVPAVEKLRVIFRTNCVTNNAFNWAVWGEPRLVEVRE